MKEKITPLSKLEKELKVIDKKLKTLGTLLEKQDVTNIEADVDHKIVAMLYTTAKTQAYGKYFGFDLKKLNNIKYKMNEPNY